MFLGAMLPEEIQQGRGFWIARGGFVDWLRHGIHRSVAMKYLGRFWV
jgi:hypothetical protein